MIWMLKFAEGDQLSVWRWEGCRAEDQRVAGREAEFIRLAVKNTWFSSTVLYTTALVSKGILSLATSCVFCNRRHLLRDGNVAILLSWTGGEQIHPCSVEIGASERNKCRSGVKTVCSGPNIHRPGQTRFQWGFPDIQMAVNKLQERLLCVRRVQSSSFNISAATANMFLLLWPLQAWRWKWWFPGWGHSIFQNKWQTIDARVNFRTATFSSVVLEKQ